MPFKLNLTFKAKRGIVNWNLDDTHELPLLLSHGPLQALFLPPDSDSEEAPYTLTLAETSVVPKVPDPPPNPDYQLYVDHVNAQGVVDASFFADGPHGVSLKAKACVMTARLEVLPGIGTKKERAHLTLKDS